MFCAEDANGMDGDGKGGVLCNLDEDLSKVDEDMGGGM